MELLDFKKGQTVRHSVSGCAATVIRPVKSRRVVTIEFTEGPRAGTWHDARPINLKLEDDMKPDLLATAPDPETTLRELWTAEGVSQQRQDELIAQITAKAQPGAKVGPFTIGQPTTEAYEPNDLERAFAILAARQDATLAGTSIEIRRKIAQPGDLSDGTRAFIVTPCSRWRWVTVSLGWKTLAEIDQRNFFQDPKGLARAVLDPIDLECLGYPYRTQLTKAGEQYMIPGTEPEDRPKSAQLSLF